MVSVKMGSINELEIKGGRSDSGFTTSKGTPSRVIPKGGSGTSKTKKNEPPYIPDGVVPPPYEKISKELAIQAAKAIHDEVIQSLDNRINSMSNEMKMLIGRQVEIESVKALQPLLERIDSLEKSLNKHTIDFQKSLDERMKMLENFHSSMESTVKNIPTPIINVTIPESAILVKQLPAEIHFPSDAIKFDMGSSLESVFKALPAPQVSVNVPKDAIEIKQLPSHVHIPENAIVVDMKAPNVIVNEKAFNVNLKQPRRQKTVRKKIEYSQTTGRPDEIVESTVIEDVEE